MIRNRFTVLSGVPGEVDQLDPIWPGVVNWRATRSTLRAHTASLAECSLGRLSGAQPRRPGLSDEPVANRYR